MASAFGLFPGNGSETPFGLTADDRCTLVLCRGDDAVYEIRINDVTRGQLLTPNIERCSKPDWTWAKFVRYLTEETGRDG